jgi:hypothetical protein
MIYDTLSTEIGVVGIWIVRGNDGEKSGSSATLGVVSALVRVVTRSCPCVVGRGFLNVWGKKLASFYVRRRFLSRRRFLRCGSNGFFDVEVYCSCQNPQSN